MAVKLVEQAPGNAVHLPNALPFTEHNFHPLTTEVRRVGYVDGGNHAIRNGAHYTIQLLRVYGSIWAEKREFAHRKDIPLVVQSMNKGGMKWVSTTGVEYEYDDKDLSMGRHLPTPTTVADNVRRIQELKMALALLEQQPTMIVLDGHLETSTVAEKNVMEVLQKKCQEQGVMLVGLSKTTTLISDTGMGLPDALLSKTTKKTWCYAPLTTDKPLCMVKLHPLGSVYRMDGPQEAANALAGHAKDAAFPGYPYPLIDADNLARVSHSEAQQYQLLLEHGQVNDAHDILNMITNH